MLTMTEQVAAAIVSLARRELPNEACGYLAADASGLVVRHYPMTNVDRSGEHFSMDPAEQFAAVKDMRGRGLVLRAVWHSHPETPARPSAEDLRLAHDPDPSYVIVSLAGREPVLRSFRIRDGRSAPEELTIRRKDMNETTTVAASRDCRGVGCPMNLVYAKVELAKIETGRVLEVILDHGAPIENVPASLAREGHELVARTRLADGSWRLLVRKAQISRGCRPPGGRP